MFKTVGLLLLIVSTTFVVMNCVNTKVPSTLNEESYLELGKSISASTQAVLGKNLMAAMGKGGPENALEFCNAKAIPLTDSMAVVLKTTIKRVSDQARNPNNKANRFEASIIAKQKQALLDGQNPMPEVHEVKSKMIAYYPIVTNAMCMTCHGKIGETVPQKTYDKISKYYPKDQAMGYDTNQIRGLWVVEMNKE
ncbi:Protein of unknown function [Spirosomataceae bacterium TFI 002]|nr:Protein of unknown function [Spirosomataceae bacterium TFI 002]